jgi:hypothetical protein
VDSHLEVIDAFVDGERVDAESLKDALADSAGRDYFVDAWTLRDAVQHDPEITVPDRRPAATMRPRAAGKWMIAAGLVAGLAGGYLVGSQTAPSPSPASVSVTIPTNVARPAPTRDAFPAPAPTRVIQLEFRIDSSGNGGD